MTDTTRSARDLLGRERSNGGRFFVHIRGRWRLRPTGPAAGEPRPSRSTNPLAGLLRLAVLRLHAPAQYPIGMLSRLSGVDTQFARPLDEAPGPFFLSNRALGLGC